MLTGNIIGFSLKEVVQMLGLVKKEGCLTVAGKGTEGEIYFSAGNIVDVKIAGGLSREQMIESKSWRTPA